MFVATAEVSCRALTLGCLLARSQIVEVALKSSSKMLDSEGPVGKKKNVSVSVSHLMPHVQCFMRHTLPRIPLMVARDLAHTVRCGNGFVLKREKIKIK